MQLGTKGKALIQGFESLALKAYQDQNGIWTIGWGHTGPAVNAQSVCTAEDADAWFTQDTQTACNTVGRLVDVALNQNQFDALVSFVFNVGGGHFHSSTLLNKLNAGHVAEAADQFLVWNIAGGKVSPGLSRRRAAERELFLTPSVSASS